MSNIEKIYSLSQMQEHLLFASLLNPSSNAYYQQIVFEIKGDLNISALTQTIQHLIEKYDILRTIYITEKVKQPVQVVLKSRKSDLNYQDITKEKESSIQKFIDNELNMRFDLSKDLLTRFLLLKKAKNNYIFVWTYHHILLDGWGRQRIWQDFLFSYQYLTQNNAIPPFKKQTFQPYINWLATKNQQSARDFWKKQLKNWQMMTSLPAQSFEQNTEYTFCQYRYSIHNEDVKNIKLFVQQEKTTLNVACNVIWAILLSHYTQQKTVYFGVVKSIFPPDLENVFGLMINTIPAKVELNFQENFRYHLNQLQHFYLVSQGFDSQSLSEIQSQNTHNQPIFDHILIFENYPVQQLITDKNQTLSFDIISQFEHSTYPLNIVFIPENESLTIQFDFNQNIYDLDFIKFVAENVGALFHQIAQNPDQNFAQLLPYSAQQQVFIEKTFALNYHNLGKKNIIQQIHQTHFADRIAIESGNHSLSYQELWQNITTTAKSLKELYHVQGNDSVAVLMNRSAEQIIYMLSILSLGANYVPIDASYPNERVQSILDDIQPKCIVKENKHIEQYTDSKKNPFENVCYTIYTSGSTGKPKGIFISQDNINSFVEGLQTSYFQNITEKDTLLYIASPAFDISLFEVLLPLVSGMKIRVIPNEQQLDYQAIFTHFETITYLHLVPSLLKNICWEAAQQGKYFPHLTHIFTGGDKVPLDIGILVKKTFPNAQFSIFYGPSECTILSSHYILPNSDILNYHYIGKPFNFNSHILINENQQFILPHVNSELLIGGLSVGLGYTDKKNNSNKFINNNLGRFYRTGDIVKYDLNGNFIFIGRNDNQLKINGKRVELSEIEICISMIEGMKNYQLLVIPKSDNPILVLFHTSHLTEDYILHKLENKLPTYMLPQIYFIEEIPYSNNGKVDNQQLILLYKQKFDTDNTQEEIITETEKQLAVIWRELLQSNDIRSNSDFFHLGGHSIKAAQLVSRIYHTFQVKIAINKIFELRTLSSISKFIDNQTIKEKSILPIAPPLPYYPISSIQQRLLILEQWEEEKGVYMLSFSLQITGKLNVNRLNKNINQIIQKNEILRTYFPKNQDSWVMKILPYKEIDILSNKTEPVFFNLEKEVPIFFKLVETKTDLYELHFYTHHALLDGLSIQQLLQEIIQVYEEDTIRTPIFQYKDYTYNLIQNIDNQEINYWLEQFKGEIPILDFPTQYPRPAYQKYEGNSLSFHFDDSILSKIDIFIKNNNITLQQFLLSNFYLLLHKYTQQTDIVVGVPYHGRNLPECEKMLGMFVNTLPIRISFSENNSFQELLKLIVSQSLAAQAHNQVRLEELIEKLNPPRNTGRNPLFDVSFVVQNFIEFPSQTGSLELTILPKARTKSLFDFSFEVIVNENQLTLNIEYATHLFTSDFINQMAIHYFNLINESILNICKPISKIEIISEFERHFLLTKGNFYTDFQYIKHTNIVTLFEQTVHQNPNKIAILGDKNYTYQALNEHANQLTNALKQYYKITSGDYILLQQPRKSVMFALMLAIWKCDAIVVPLDNQLPELRVKEIERISNAKLLIDNNFYEDSLKNLATERPNWLDLNINYQSHICYCIFTSGSTGKPKGVNISHQNLLSAVASWKEVFPHDMPIILQLAGFSFDVFLGDFAKSLLSQGTLVLTNEIQRMLAEELLYIIDNQNITHLETTPAMLPFFLQELESNGHKYSLSSLSYFIVGSDIFNFQQYSNLRKLLPKNIKIINSYGLTECTIDSSYYFLDEHNYNSYQTSLPIGQPLPNTQFLILDKAQNLVPTNIWGELYIGGDSVGLGYLNDEELTHQKYIYLQNFDNQCFYKTGDIAKWESDGNVIFKGRNDNMLKIRGFRIEIAEIEQILTQYTEILDAVVISIFQAHEPILIAFYTGKTLDNETIKTHCANSLPNYMIPHSFIWQEKLPLTPSGKINKKELEIIANQEIIKKNKPKDFYQYSATQKLVLNWISELTHQPDIKLTSHFFEVGGNSLRAVQLVNRINEKWNIKFSLKHIFIKNNIEDIIYELEKEIQKNNNFSYEIKKTTHVNYIPLSPAQRRMWMLDQMQLIQNSYNLVSIFELGSNINFSKIEKAITQVIQRHEVLRTNFLTNEGLPYQFIHHNFEIRNYLFTHYQIDKDKVLKQEAQFIFDLSQDKLIRFHFIIDKNNSKFLILNVHHIIYDGWSDAILLREIATFYQDETIEKLPIQYKDYTNWQLQNEQNSNLFNFWINKFQNFNSKERLLENIISESKNDTKTEIVVRKSLPITLSQQIEAYTQKHQATDFSFFYSVFALTLAHFSQQNDFVIGTVFSGRTHQQLENLIGLFLNTLAIRTQISNAQTLKTFFIETQNNLIEAFEHQDFPIEKLISYLRLPYDTSRNPLFDVAIIMQNYETGASENVDFQFKMLENPYRSARLDLTLYIQKIENCFHLEFEFNNDLFCLPVIEKISDKFLEISQLFLKNDAILLSNLLQETPHSLTPKMETNKEIIVQNKVEMSINPILAQIFKELLNISDVDGETHFFKAGGYSLKALQLCHEISKQIKIDISLRKVYENSTIYQLSQQIGFMLLKSNTHISPKIFPIKPLKNTKRAYFFVPPILGSSTIFKPLCDVLIDDCYGLQYAGLEENETFENAIEEMALRMAKDIIAINNQFPLEKKLTIVGYSMGALIAFEIAKILEINNLPIDLILLDKSIEVEKGDEIVENKNEVENYVQSIIAQLQSLDNGLYHSQYVQRVKNLYIHNTYLMQEYQQTGKVNCPILAIEAINNEVKTNMEDWEIFTTKSFYLKNLECTHYEILNSEYILKLKYFLENEFE